jgi:glyceraldehyde 3-phosphate dehydrogenase
MRVPVITGSIVDVTFIAKKSTSVEEVNSILEEASKTERWKEIFSVTKEELVSSDIVGSSYASIADLSMTRVVGGNLVKVLAWYDNEKGYSRTLLNHVIKIGHSIK